MTIVVKTAADDRDAPMDPTALYHAFADAYNAACAAVGSISRSYRIAGYTVRLCFAGGALEPLLTPALAHLASVDAAPPDLTLHLWDGASTGSAPPALGLLRILIYAANSRPLAMNRSSRLFNLMSMR